MAELDAMPRGCALLAAIGVFAISSYEAGARGEWGNEAEDGVQRDRGYRPGRARGIPDRDAQALLRRAHPGGAARLRQAAGPVADHARVRGRPGHDGAPADRDRALQVVESRQAAGRAGAA